MSTARLRGVDIAYEDRPTDVSRWRVDAIVLVHGWSCDSSDWDSFVPVLRPYGRIVTFDLRGHGRSGMPPGALDEALTPSAMAADLKELMDHLGLRRVVLIAHSAGAEIAAEFAMTHPDRVAAIAFSDPAFGVDPSVRDRLEATANELDLARDGSRVADYFAAVSEPAPLAAAHRELALRARPEISAAMFRGFNLAPGTWHFEPGTAERLAMRAWPMFVAYRNEARARFGRTIVRKRDLVLVLEGGHWPHQEHTEEFVGELLPWLDATVA